MRSSNLETIPWEKHSWKYLSLIGDETVILQRAKVYVFSDSVLCLGRVHQHPESKGWKKRIGWIIIDKSYRDHETPSQDSQRSSSAVKSQIY